MAESTQFNPLGRDEQLQHGQLLKYLKLIFIKICMKPYETAQDKMAEYFLQKSRAEDTKLTFVVNL